MIKFQLNGQEISTDTLPDTPLLWVVRDELNLKGTKFGCGIGAGGTSTAHLNGSAIRSCKLPLSAVADADITTVEGLDSAAGMAPTAGERVRDLPIRL